jgi:hypothetical protein
MEHFTQQVGETAIENRKILDSSTLLKTGPAGSRVSLKRLSICPFLAHHCAMDASHGRIVTLKKKIHLLVSSVFLSDVLHLSRDLVGSTELTADLGAGQDALTVLVKLELGDDDVGGVEAQGDALAAGLVTGDTLDVDHVLETVDRGDLALTAFVRATDNGDLVVLADGDAADLLRRMLVSVMYKEWC